MTYQFPAFATEVRNTKHILDVKPVVKKIFSVEMEQQSKFERANETRCDKPWTKINLKAQGKYPMSKNILKPLRFSIVILQHKVLLHSIAFKVFLCIMKHLPNQVLYCKTRFLALPRLAYLIFNRPIVGKTTLLRQKSQKNLPFRIASKLAKAQQYLLL